MYSQDVSDLPIAQVLEPLRRQLGQRDELVLQAPPGAGKTTLVPLELLNEPWLDGRKILLLEPRRVAARAAAGRMAQLLGERVGQRVGYRIRLDTCISDETRIEVITEGILTRMLQQDPALEDIGLIIFDEFHERNLDSDLCLALVLQGRELLREDSPLKLLVMSATLNGTAVAELMDDAPVVTSEGRQYPVQTYFGDTHRLKDRLTGPVVTTVMRALNEQEGSVLVFLPGQREIRQVERELATALSGDGQRDVRLAPLYGGLDLKQQQAIEPAPQGQRKVVLATNIAETSLTIDGISTVVDSGLAREPRFDTSTGMTRLATTRISRASAEQRMGRAGRLGPGHCYRLWSEEQQQRLIAHSTPEIAQADLAPLALQLLAWGVKTPRELSWLDLPPEGPYQQAENILEICGALFSNAAGERQLTPHGVRMAQMPVHPRLAHMLLLGCDIHAVETASLLAAMLSERNPVADQGADIGISLGILMGEVRCPPEHETWFRRTWDQARRFVRIATDTHSPRPFAMEVPQQDVIGVLLASAYPDRIAMRRAGQKGGEYQLSNGRSAVLPDSDSLAGEPWLAVAQVGGRVGESADRIYGATALSEDRFDDVLASLTRDEERIEWDYDRDQFIAERRRCIGKLDLSSEQITEVSEESRGIALLGVVRKEGLHILPWSESLRQWRARVNLLHGLGGHEKDQSWPDLSDDALLASLEQWLLPYLDPVRRLQDFQQLDLKAIMQAMLPWPLPLELERLAPERLAVPSGSSIAIDYLQEPPVLSVKLQEMFGCDEAPAVAGGRVPLLVHLLSPAGRPLQITQDLGGFWRSGYQEVRREMKGRYPKHPWPEDPTEAQATRHTKRRLQQA